MLHVLLSVCALCFFFFSLLVKGVEAAPYHTMTIDN